MKDEGQKMSAGRQRMEDGKEKNKIGEGRIKGGGDGGYGTENGRRTTGG